MAASHSKAPVKAESGKFWSLVKVKSGNSELNTLVNELAVTVTVFLLIVSVARLPESGVSSLNLR